jgi:hypothetical protein
MELIIQSWKFYQTLRDARALQYDEIYQRNQSKTKYIERSV